MMMLNKPRDTTFLVHTSMPTYIPKPLEVLMHNRNYTSHKLHFGEFFFVPLSISFSKKWVLAVMFGKQMEELLSMGGRTKEIGWIL